MGNPLAPLHLACKQSVYFRNENDRLKKIKNIFKILGNNDQVALRDSCFKAVITACDKGEWGKIQQNKELIGGLKNSSNETVFTYFASCGNKKKIKEIIDLKLDDPLSDGQRQLALHASARGGHLKVLRFLGKQGDFDFNHKNSEGVVPLQLAIENGHPALIKPLLNFQSRSQTLFRAKVKENNFPLNPLGLSIYKGQIQCLDELIQYWKSKKIPWKKEFKLWTQEFGTHLHLVVFAGQFAMLEHLFLRYNRLISRLIEKKNDEGQTPLMIAAKQGCLEAFNRLINAGANLEAQDCLGRRAMHLAAMHGHVSIVQCLIQKNAKINPIDNQGATPFTLSKKQKRNRCTLILLNATQKKNIVKQGYTNYIESPADNVVFFGRAYNDDVYLGIVQALEKFSMIKSSERFGGTSFGALIATLLALGLDANRTHTILLSSPFKAFFGTYLKTVDDDEFLELKRKLNSIDSPHEKRNHLFEAIKRNVGIETGTHLQDWLEKFVKNETNIENCTFGDLAALIKKTQTNPFTNLPYKHLHLIAIDTNTFQPLQFNSEDKKWREYFIADAVMSALALALLVKPQIPRKKLSKNRIIQSPYRCLSGEIFSASPAEIFDHKHYVRGGEEQKKRVIPCFNPSTLAFNVYLNRKISINSLSTVKDYVIKILQDCCLGSDPLNWVGASQNDQRLVYIPEETIEKAYEETEAFFSSRGSNSMHLSVARLEVEPVISSIVVESLISASINYPSMYPSRSRLGLYLLLQIYNIGMQILRSVDLFRILILRELS